MTVEVIMSMDTNSALGSIVAFLSNERRCYSRTRFEEESTNLGLGVAWLNPRHFDLLVDSRNPQAYYRSRPLQPPIALVSRLGSDTTSFARAVIRHVETIPNVAVINSSESIMRARDKLLTHQLLCEAGIPTPRTVLARQPSDVAKMVRLVDGPPVILKLMSGTHGKGVMLGKDMEEIQSSLETVWALNNTLLIQEYVRESAGSDIRVIVAGGQAIGAIKRVAKLGSFRANVHQGAAVESYPLDEEVEFLALRASEAIGLEVSGVDLVRSATGYAVIEVNSAPGFSGFERATGLNVATHFLRYAAERALECREAACG